MGKRLGLLHIHGGLQLAFQKLTALITYGFSLLFFAFDNYDKIIGITTVSNRRLPLPALLNGNFTPFQIRQFRGALYAVAVPVIGIKDALDRLAL